MAKDTENRLAYGLTILVFGVLFLLDKVGILARIPYGKEFISIGSLFLVAGIIFLLTKTEKKMGIIFTGIGVVINSDLFFGWMRSYSSLIVPIVLIVVGLIMVLASKK